MDKKEAINKFIKDHSFILRQDPFLERDYLKLKKNFFLSKLPSIPKDSEIAQQSLELMIKSNQLKTEADLNRIYKYPFFNENVRDKKYWSDKVKVLSEQKEPLIDVQKLDEGIYREEIIGELQKEALDRLKTDKQIEIKELEEKKKELIEKIESLPSILDLKEYPLPKIEEEPSVDDERVIYLPWWEKLFLKSNPFQILEGLSKIDSTLFDQVLFKTELFKKYDSLLKSKSINDIFQTVVIAGEFGSGKTTFFDYLNNELYNHKIYPVYIQLSAEFEIREIVFDFKKQLINNLLTRYTNLTGKLINYDTLNDDEVIFELFKKLSSNYNGFIVFIDDLHKGDIEKAMKVMSNLQILTSQLTRKTSNINIGYFVAGSLEWEEKLKEPKYSGSFSKVLVIKKLEIDDAFIAINRRLKVYSKNPENPRQLNRIFLEHIYEEIEKEGRIPTFRRVIREILNSFEEGNFGPLIINPFDIPQDVLEQIKNYFQNDQYVYNTFMNFRNNKLLNNAQKKACLDLFLNIYLNIGLYERDFQTKDLPFLQQLERNKLIFRSVVDQDTVFRTPMPIYNLNRKIINEFKLSLEDYLIKLFFTDLLDKEEEIIIKPDVKNIDELIDKLKGNDTIYDLLNESRAIHKDLVHLDSKKILRADHNELIKLSIKSLALLTKAYFLYEKQTIETPITHFEVLNNWKYYWWQPESLSQFQRSLEIEVTDRKKELGYIINLYREAYPEIVLFFKMEFEKNNQIRLPIDNLKNDEIKLLHECRDLWIANDYKNLSTKLASYIEKTIRNTLFNYFTIFYGDYENRLLKLDKQSKQYIQKNIGDEKRRIEIRTTNEFTRLNRGQYKTIMTGINGSSEGRRNWLRIFSHIFPYNESELYEYLDLFGNINIEVSHNIDDGFTHENQDYVYQFMQKSIRFLKSINEGYTKLLEKDYIVQKPTCLFSFCKFTDKDELIPILIEQSDIITLQDSFSGKTMIKIPLDNQEYIEAAFGIPYRKFYALLSIILNDIKCENLEINYKITDVKGSQIYIEPLLRKKT